MRGRGLDEMVMTDVAPFTLGVETSIKHGEGSGSRIDGQFLPIIERNTVIPVSRSEVVHTIEDNQRRMAIRVFQGESRLVKDNVRLGELNITLAPAPAGKERVDIRFTYDTSGLLEVDVTTLSTGRTQALVIEGNPGVLQPDEIAKRLAALAKLKVHPRDDIANRTLIARAERLYEERLGDTRALIGEALGIFTIAVERQKPDEVERARKKLTEMLDELDRGFFV
jgi:molecular chaperone HscC